MHLVYNKHKCYNEKVGVVLMLFNKTNHVIQLMNEHAESIVRCYSEYVTIFNEIIELQSKSMASSFDRGFTDRHKIFEHEADQVRHKVITQLLQGGLLAESRKSTLILIEGNDNVANITEEILRMIVFERIEISLFLISSLKMINDITMQQLLKYMDVFKKIMTKYDFAEMTKDLRLIETYETQVDAVKNELIIQLFELNISLANKLQLKALIKLISQISDEIEDLSDEIEIILSSRRV